MSSITASTTLTQSSTKSRPLINNPIFPWSRIRLTENYNHLFPRYGHSSCSTAIQNELYFFGGISNEKFNSHVFVMNTNTYGVKVVKTTGNKPSPRSGHTHVRVESNLIVFGGKLESIEEKPDYNLYVLNLETKVWKKPSIKGVTPLGRFGHTAALVGSVMYVFGGCIDGCYLNDLVAIDTKLLNKNNKNGACWHFIDPINEPPPKRTGHISCAYEGKIYIFGGTDGEQCFNDTWYYNTETKEWVELTFDTFIPIPRESHGSTLVDDIIYVFGGRSNDGRELVDLAAFGINNKRWYMFQKMGPSPGPRFCLTVSSSKNSVMIFGGKSSRSRKLDEEGYIHILDTAKLKYPSEPYFGSSSLLEPSPLQIVLSTFPQQKSLPKLRQQQTNDGKEIREIFEEVNQDDNKTELRARNPDIKAPSSRPSSRPPSRPPSRPSSHNFNINVTVTTTTSTARGNLNRRSLVKDNNNSRPSSIADSKKLLITNEINEKNDEINEKVKKSRISSQKEEKEVNNIQYNNDDNEKGISSGKQLKDTKQQNKPNLHIDTEKIYESTKSYNKLSVERGGLQRQRSTDSIRSISSVRSFSSVLSSPSLRPRGARTLEKRSKIKLSNLDKVEPSTSSSSQNGISTRKETVPSKSQEEAVPTKSQEEAVPTKSREKAMPTKSQEAMPTKSQEAMPTKSQEEAVPSKSQEAAVPAKSQEAVSTKLEETPASSPTIQITAPEQEGSQEGSKPPPIRPPRRRLDSLTNSTTTSRNYPTTQLSSAERENFIERLSDADFKISEMRKREKLYQAEIDLARKAGFIPTFSFSDDNNEDLENIVDINEFVDIGEPGSEKFKVIEAIIKLSKQLQKAKETIAYQERVTSQKVSDFERLYTASLEETAYFKAKFAALMNEYEAERLARTADDVEEIKQTLNEKSQKLEKTSKDVEEVKIKVDLISDQESISSRFREIAIRCDELESLHEIAHKELQDSISKYKETAKNAQEALTLKNTLENTTVKSQKQLVDIKNRLSQVELDYQVAINCTTSTEQILNNMKEDLIQSKLEMDKVNEKLIDVEDRNGMLENRLKELQNTMNPHSNRHSNLRNSVLQEYADQSLVEQQANYEKERESLYQQIQELQTKISLAKDEKNMMDQGYEALRRIYESMRRQNEILKKSNVMLEEQSLESEKKGEELRNELVKTTTEFGQEEKDEENSEASLEEENLTTDEEENQEEVDPEKWEQEKKLLEQEISQYQQSNENLEKSNLELKKNVNDSEGKIAILLDQMENAVDTYRGIEDNMREGSPALVGPILRNKVSSSSLKKEPNSNSSN